jgi:hypothetical protein
MSPVTGQYDGGGRESVVPHSGMWYVFVSGTGFTNRAEIVGYRPVGRHGRHSGRERSVGQWKTAPAHPTYLVAVRMRPRNRLYSSNDREARVRSQPVVSPRVRVTRTRVGRHGACHGCAFLLHCASPSSSTSPSLRGAYEDITGRLPSTRQRRHGDY